MTYPNEPGHTKHVDTSREAAQSVKTQASAQCQHALEHLTRAGAAGRTLDEMVGLMAGSFPDLIKNNLSARLGQLCADGKAVRLDRKRTAPGGRSQSVYVTMEHAPVDYIKQEAGKPAGRMTQQDGATKGDSMEKPHAQAHVSLDTMLSIRNWLHDQESAIWEMGPRREHFEQVRELYKFAKANGQG